MTSGWGGRAGSIDRSGAGLTIVADRVELRNVDLKVVGGAKLAVDGSWVG
jgi:hypothetical protein